VINKKLKTATALILAAAVIVSIVSAVGFRASANEPALLTDLAPGTHTRADFVNLANSVIFHRELTGMIVFANRTYEAGKFFDTYADTGITFAFDSTRFNRETHPLPIHFEISGFSAVQHVSTVQTSPPQTPPAAQSNSINIFADGTLVNFDQQPIQEDGRTLVPLRGIFETMGADVMWNPDSQTVTAIREDITVVLPVGSETAVVNSEPVSMGWPAVPARIVGGRTMIPLRFISETLGMHVHSEVGGGTIRISTEGQASSVRTQATPAATTLDEVAYWRAHIESTQSQIRLPNRQLTVAERAAWISEYHELGGANAFELEIIRLVNEIRREYGLNELEIEQTNMYAARFHVQTLATHPRTGTAHTAGPYGGSGATVRAFGGNGSSGAWQGGGFTPEGVVRAWMNSPGHRATLMMTRGLDVGIGTYGAHRYIFVQHHMW